MSTVDSDEVLRLRAEVQALRARRKGEISAGAHAFVQAHASRVTPAEGPFLAWIYTQLATADEEQTFPEGGFSVSVGDQDRRFPDRISVLRHAMDLRPDLSRSQERVVADATVSGLKVVDNGSVGSDPEADAYAQGRKYAESANRRRA